ncbi:hypothetical protein [Pseudoalteromonas sp. T1lg21]|uniref:hypothetical protein n=1 Tax=Pseudoalteromonas sp. T1lg21 TaxID=2077095 RepID=UPI001F2B4D30|nr:hypothetical protein [Pseudoalteromonas sp. T1lg21]
MLPNMIGATGAAIGSNILPVGAAQPTSSIWGDMGGFLSDAVASYGQYEAIKAAKNSTGQGRMEYSSTPELKNGAARLVDQQIPQANSNQQTETMVFGFPQKNVIMAFGGLLVLGLILKGRS